MKNVYPRDLLNKIKWDAKYNMSNLTVIILHRGAPNDAKEIVGDEIVDIGPNFFELINGTMIPYHRIIEIRYRGEVIYRKRKS